MRFASVHIYYTHICVTKEKNEKNMLVFFDFFPSPLFF